MGLMRGMTFRGAWLLAALLSLLTLTERTWGQATGLAAWPGMSVGIETPQQSPRPVVLVARGNDSAPGSPGYAPAATDCNQLPLPLGSTRPEDGGLFAYGRFA